MEILAQLVEWFKELVALFKRFAAGFEEKYLFEEETF